MIQASKRVSFKNFCDVAEVAIIHKMRQFSQFGYKQDMKIKKLKHPSLFFGYMLLKPNREIQQFCKNFILFF